MTAPRTVSSRPIPPAPVGEPDEIDKAMAATLVYDVVETCFGVGTRSTLCNELLMWLEGREPLKPATAIRMIGPVHGALFSASTTWDERRCLLAAARRCQDLVSGAATPGAVARITRRDAATAVARVTAVLEGK